MKNKLPYIITGIYVVLYLTLLPSYFGLPPRLNSEQQALFVYSWYVPILLLIPLFVPKAMKVLDKLASVKAWNYVLYAALPICVTLQIIVGRGLWWSWTTAGLLLVIIVLIMNLVKDKVSSGEGLLLGCAGALLGSGLWEMLFHTGLLHFHTYFGDPIEAYFFTIKFLFVWSVVGAIILLELVRRHTRRELIHINGAFITCTALFAVLTTVWLANGMWLEVWYYKDMGPFTYGATPMQLSIIRGSKAFFCLILPMSLIAPRNKAAYDWEAFSSWNLLRRWWKKTTQKKVWALAGTPDRVLNDKVLDVGCGSSQIITHFPNAIGIDTDEDKIEFMRHKTAKQKFKCMDGRKLEFEDKSFDLVLCAETLEHQPTANPMLSEIARVLRPGGHAIITTPDNSTLRWKIIQFVYNIVGEYRGQHTTLFTPNLLKVTAEKYGLKLIQLEYVAKCDMVALFRRELK